MTLTHTIDIDVLSQFPTSSKPPAALTKASPAPAPAPATATPEKKPKDTKTKPDARKLPSSLEDLDISEDFAKELADGMAALMREIAAEAGDKPEEKLPKASQEDLEREAKFRKAWEDMLVEGMNGALDGEDVGGKGKTAAAKSGEEQKADVPDDGFQASIRKAMEKLKESDSSLQVCLIRDLLKKMG